MKNKIKVIENIIAYIICTLCIILAFFFFLVFSGVENAVVICGWTFGWATIWLMIKIFEDSPKRTGKPMGSELSGADEK